MSESPSTEAELADLVLAAAAEDAPLAVAGGDTRSGLGPPVQAARTIRTTSLAGITAYEPAEMVMTARAGTPVSEIEATLAEHRQRLLFEPMDHRPLYRTDGEPTIGGVAAVNATGPRRFVAGAARDAMLGLRFVNGRGEAVQAGGRVMKNVTGLDLVKLLVGSRGRLGVLSEVTFKVAPAPETVATFALEGLETDDAVRALAAAMATSTDVSGAAHMPAEARTYLRLEGFETSVGERAAKLAQALAAFGTLQRIEADPWHGIRDATVFNDGSDSPVWRVSVAPSAAPTLLDALGHPPAFLDWQGGLVWIGADVDHEILRREIDVQGGGHATLVRGPATMRAAIPVFQPPGPVEAKLIARLRERFDPNGVFAAV